MFTLTTSYVKYLEIKIHDSLKIFLTSAVCQHLEIINFLWIFLLLMKSFSQAFPCFQFQIQQLSTILYKKSFVRAQLLEG